MAGLKPLLKDLNIAHRLECCGQILPGCSESVVEVGRVDAGVLDHVQVDSPKEDENGDVFQVVLVRPSHSLYIRVGTSDFSVRSQLAIFRADEGLQ